MAPWWAEKDSAAASEWVMKFPEGKYKDQLLGNVVLPWALSRPDEFKKWLGKSSLSQAEKDKLLKKLPVK